MPAEPPSAPEISVIVCTRDRPRQLRDCLSALRTACEASPEVRTEVVIIENASAPELALQPDAMTGAPATTRIVPIAAGGLSRARNLGMEAARGDLFAFVDDDCEVDARWLADVHMHWRALSGDFVLGGRVRLADARDLPFTIKDFPQPQVFDPAVHPGGFIHGCNFCMPRRTARRIGLFDERFGAGARFRAGEDTDYLLRAHRHGIPIHYTPDMLVLHRHGRRTFAEMDLLNRAYAYANGALLAKHVLRHPWLARHLFWTIRSAARERRGGPPFDVEVGLTWRSVARAQVLGIAAFLWAALGVGGRLS